MLLVGTQVRHPGGKLAHTRDPRTAHGGVGSSQETKPLAHHLGRAQAKAVDQLHQSSVGVGVQARLYCAVHNEHCTTVREMQYAPGTISRDAAARSAIQALGSETITLTPAR